MSNFELAHVDALLETLAPWVADAPFAMPLHIGTFAHIARWRRMPLPVPRSAYASALLRLADSNTRGGRLDGGLASVLEGLDAATAARVLKDAVRVTGNALAPAIADAMAERKLIPGPRLAAQLARVSLPRCLELLSRLERTTDAQDAYVRSVGAAYLSARAVGPVPNELASVWNELAARSLTILDTELAATRLEVSVVEDPLTPVAVLAEALEQHGAAAFGNVAATVVSAMTRHDRAGVLELASEGWPVARATLLEGIAVAEPSAPEIGPMFDSILIEWRDGGGQIDRSPAGTVELTFPLLRVAIAARDYTRARAAVVALQPSPFMLAAATWRAMRVTNLADEVWRPAVWDDLIGATDAASEGTVPDVSPTVAAALWKIETLPLADLPWFDTSHP